MQYIYILLAFISLIILSYQVKTFLSEGNQKYAFFIAIALINLINFQLTLYTSFWMAQSILYIAMLALLGYILKNNGHILLKEFLKDNKTFFGLSFFWFILTLKAQVLGWDDFYWASFVKYLNMFGHYWDANSTINREVLRYLPGIPLWEAFFIGKNNFNEQALFFSLGLFFLAGLSALLTKKSNYKEFMAITILYSAGVRWFAPGGINNISTDGSIGIVFAFCLILIFNFKSLSDLIGCLILIAYMAITKETAFLLSLLCLFIIFVRLLREKIVLSKYTAYLLAGFVVIAFNNMSWQRHLEKVNLAMPVAKVVIDGFKNDLQAVSARTHDTLITFKTAILSRPFPESLISNVHGTYVICALLVIIFLIAYARKHFEYFIGFILGLTGYTAVLLSNWLYFSGEYEGRYLASYERYLGMFFLGFALFLIFLILEKKLYQNKYFKTTLIVILCAFPPYIRMFFPPSIRSAIPEWVNKIKVINKDQSRIEVGTIKNKILEKTAPESRIWMIWQNSTGFQNMVLRYEVLPRFVNQGQWSIGEKYYEGDVWTAPMNANEFIGSTKGYDYLVLGKIDDKFIQNYSKAFSSTPKESGLYKVVKTNNQIQLIEVN